MVKYVYDAWGHCKVCNPDGTGNINGSIAWYDYLGATVLGAVIGGAIGAGLSWFAGTSITISIPILESVGVAELTITGSQVLVGIGALVYLSSLIGKSGGYRVKQYYPNDHYPPHVHIYGDDIHSDHGIRVGLDGNPLPGEPKLPPGARKALKKLWEVIVKALLSNGG